MKNVILAALIGLAEEWEIRARHLYIDSTRVEILGGVAAWSGAGRRFEAKADAFLECSKKLRESPIAGGLYFAGRWVPVAEGKPNVGEAVLVFGILETETKPYVQQGYFSAERWWSQRTQLGEVVDLYIESVTHWCWMPDGPDCGKK